ncbi:DUF4136 domain-containing protein [Grimontia sp. NTOU-MAR1]|uniref:DUF4136 domain-containing protein n=1 Tax=Grimontia sp. NTOU-MAR1 TaxID=3111011 RepID=UPI002DBEB2CF|nr:DUF4136 domain-containing protein [Grimontia sp. NTOU-MAR1]WRW00384.1 DUF4136 domain-containing protein [Grimontia sp. NTOU-MAR1]
MSARIFPIFFVLLLAGCAKSVYTDFDQQFPYQEIETYDIAAKSSTSPISLDDSRIERALEREMAIKGIEEAKVAPNVTLRYFVQPKTEAVAYGPSFSFGYGTGRFGARYETPVRIEERDYGQLVVEMVDNQSNQVVWRAVSKRKLTDSMTPSSKNEFINEQVKDMFANFPPSNGE